MKLIRVGEVAEKCASSVPKIWNEAANNPDFPKPVKPSPGITAWVEAEVDAYLVRKVEEYRSKPTKRGSTFKAARASAERRRYGGQQ